MDSSGPELSDGDEYQPFEDADSGDQRRKRRAANQRQPKSGTKKRKSSTTSTTKKKKSGAASTAKKTKPMESLRALFKYQLYARLLSKTSLDSIGLEEYLQIGGITYRSGPSSDDIAQNSQGCYCSHCVASNDWRHWHHPPDSMPEDHPLFEVIGELTYAQCIRVFELRQKLRLSKTSTDEKNLKLVTTLRVYLLPDDVSRGTLPRPSTRLRSHLKTLMKAIDASAKAWNGNGSPDPGEVENQYASFSTEEDSLFYLFNTVDSPQCRPERLKDVYSRQAMEDLLTGPLDEIGIKTELYPYQRRSAAMMLEREANPKLNLDPRLQVYQGPTGQRFYYDRYRCLILQGRQDYEEPRGGILAESMGYGKTLICLSVILATKGHRSQIPIENIMEVDIPKPANGCRPLLETTVVATAKANIPWRLFFDEHEKQGEEYTNITTLLQNVSGTYNIETPVSARLRNMGCPTYRTIHTSSTTLVVVPQNLLSQWQEQIQTHLEPDALSLLVVDTLQGQLPPPEELARYDMILMARSRFDREASSIIPERPAPRIVGAAMSTALCHDCGRLPPCSCTLHMSPLKHVQFLRIIVDEGHNFAAAGSSSMSLLQSIKVDRRWIVSGTPSSGLIGVDVNMAAFGSSEMDDSDKHENKLGRQATLQRRRKEITLTQERKDVTKLGGVLRNFFDQRPWANAALGEDMADWNIYVVPTKNGERKPASLKNVLDGLIVRHRIEDVETNIQLPPLHNRVVRLEPCDFDRITYNLFILILATNAITSERADRDFMFHPDNRPQLDSLIKNLRQAAFTWTSITQAELRKTTEVAEKYLEKEDGNSSEADRDMLASAIAAARHALDHPSWRAFSESHEVGIYIRDFPIEAMSSWSLGAETSLEPLLMGATQVSLAQRHVDKKCRGDDPFDGLVGAAIRARKRALRANDATTKRYSSHKIKDGNAVGVPVSVLESSNSLGTRHFRRPSQTKPPSPSKIVAPDVQLPDDALGEETPLSHDPQELPTKYDEVAKASIVGTNTAKLSYLIDRIVALQSEEKILVFYEGDQIAYYIAQALEILGIPHFIYSSGIHVRIRNQHLQTFMTTPTERVMLMDLRQASHGLHVSAASRVFFVNPVWQPSVEAQAIKRAHRIGQTRPVHVETLVLSGTLEEKMLERRKAMSSQEHQTAEKSLLDDQTMTDIIKNATFVDLKSKETSCDMAQMAPLARNYQLFGRQYMELAAKQPRGAITVEPQPPPPKAAGESSSDSSSPREPRTPTPLGERSPQPMIIPSGVSDAQDLKRKRAMFADEERLPPPDAGSLQATQLLEIQQD